MTNGVGHSGAVASIYTASAAGMLRSLLGMVVAVVTLGLCLAAPVVAQQIPAPAAPEVRQLQLTDAQVTGFIGAQKDLIAITAKLEAAGDTIDEKLQKELDDIGRKHGFKDFADFEEIRTNVMMVLAGIDPDTGEYSDPIELIKKDIEAIKADKSLSEEDRKSQLEEMNDALKEMQPLKYKANIDVVKKFAKQIDEVLK